MRLVLPWAYHTLVMCRCHDDLGHLGTEHRLDLLHDQFYWPTMQDNVEQHIWGCGGWNRLKQEAQHDELYPILATYPLELVHIDFIMIKNPKNGKDVNVLVMTDCFTRYVQAIVTTSQTALVMAWALWDGFFTHYGFPTSILSDQGHNFESNLIKEFCDLGVSVKSTLPLTTHRGMNSANSLIPP